jgi:carbonic anhydrase/acetyltransferase-like protein (isoleucine patch superfamily)
VPVHHWQAPIFAFEGRSRRSAPRRGSRPTATLVGDVRVEAEASTWWGACAAGRFRGDHRGGGQRSGWGGTERGSDPVTEVGEEATVGHPYVVHRAVIAPPR